MEQGPDGSSHHPQCRPIACLAAVAGLLVLPSLAVADSLDDLRSRQTFRWGADEEGGAPFAYRDEEDPSRLIGFEAELAGLIAQALHVRAEFRQAQWDQLLPFLERGDVDVVLNGYEWTAVRARRFLATRTYYVYQYQLMTRKDALAHCWADLRMPRPGGGRWRVGVLIGSASMQVAEQLGGPGVEVVTFPGATDAMMATQNGQIDATLQDLAASVHYLKRPEFANLGPAGPPEGLGYYVMFLRPGDERLRDAIDEALARLIESGELKALYQRYGIWNEAQELLASQGRHAAVAVVGNPPFDLDLLVRFFPSLLAASGMTILLSFASFPLAMAIGLGVAVGRLYGPRPLAWVLGGFVEAVRGTPLMFQLFVIFYLLPRLGVALDPLAAGILGLAINYSAYEAEIYRAGLQAVPIGQMEAALALGMSRPLAIRRVLVPQAARIAIPPMTNDFIALFKDTSVCSAITLTELTKQYSILANTLGGVLEFGLAAAVLYMAMSLPLSWFSRKFERLLDAEKSAGGVS